MILHHRISSGGRPTGGERGGHRGEEGWHDDGRGVCLALGYTAAECPVAGLISAPPNAVAAAGQGSLRTMVGCLA